MLIDIISLAIKLVTMTDDDLFMTYLGGLTRKLEGGEWTDTHELAFLLVEGEIDRRTLAV